MDPALLKTILPIVIFVGILGLRLRSMSKRRPLNVARLWIAPIILVVLAIGTLVAHPPSPLGLGLCGAALGLGAAVGWHRGKLTRIERDPATGDLYQQASPAALILLLAIIGIRFAVRSYFGTQATPGRFDAQTLIVTDALLCFAVAMVAATRIEIGLRARALLAERSPTA